VCTGRGPLCAHVSVFRAAANVCFWKVPFRLTGAGIVCAALYLCRNLRPIGDQKDVENGRHIRNNASMTNSKADKMGDVDQGVAQSLHISIEQAAAEAKRFAQIIESSLNEIYIFDALTLKFVQVNFGARRNMGYSSAEFRTLTPADIKSEMTHREFETLISPLRDGTERLLVFKTVHQRKNGSTYPVEVHLQLVQTGGESVFAAIIQDISEQLRTEDRLRQSQKMEAIGQLTGGIAHDFNNLLTVVLGNAELLRGHVRDEDKASGLLNDIIAAAESGASLTHQLLGFARRIPLQPQPVDLNALVIAMSDLLTRSLGETIEFRCELAAPPSWVLADPGQTQNALLNLAINARDAMPQGGGLTIATAKADLSDPTVALKHDVEPGQYVCLSVSDNGSGMSEDVRRRAMEPFFTTKDLGKGTGLGLSMVHGFAKQSSGHLDISSELGRGTSINLFLPVANAGQDEPMRVNGSRQSDVARKKIVLVVEDDARVRKITVNRLEHLGYQAIAAENGKKALEVLATSKDIDLVCHRHGHARRHVWCPTSRSGTEQLSAYSAAADIRLR
jgi:PAS domain S-box-containing protein